MSDIEDGDDLEFLRAFEDELYNDTLSIGSDNSLDSEIEAELYQKVHFASSLIETATNNCKEEENSLDLSRSPSANWEKNECDSGISDKLSQHSDYVDGESSHVNQKSCLDDPSDQKDSSVNFYPEVKLLFSNDELSNKLHKVKKSTVSKLFEANIDGDVFMDVGDEWAVIAADLMPKPKRKKLRCRCLNCNEWGHRTLECTIPKKEKVCWLCGEVGHLRKSCKNDLCFNCKTSGHRVKKCPKPRCRAEDTCNRCHAYGHFESFCPDRWRQYHHTVKEGEIVRGTQNFDSKRKNIFCYNCGGKGHLGHECVEERPGYFDPCFSFVVTYDRSTSSFAPRIHNRNLQANEQSSTSPRKNENIDASSQSQRKSKRSRKRKKQTAEVAEDVEEKATKRRKIGDGEGDVVIRMDNRDNGGQVEDQKLNYTEDNCDKMKTFANFNNAMPNLPLQPLMSFDFDFTSNKDRQKREPKNPLQPLMSFDFDYTSNKDRQKREPKKPQGRMELRCELEQNRQKKKNKLGQKQRRARRNFLERQRQMASCNSNGVVEICPATPTENGELKKKKNKKKKKKRKEDKINLEALSSTGDFKTAPNSSVVFYAERNANLLPRKNCKDQGNIDVKESPVNSSKKPAKNPQNKRKVSLGNQKELTITL